MAPAAASHRSSRPWGTNSAADCGRPEGLACQIRGRSTAVATGGVLTSNSRLGVRCNGARRQLGYSLASKVSALRSLSGALNAVASTI